MGLVVTAFALAVVAVLSGQTGRRAAFDWDLPPGFPEPLVPADNPMTAEKTALGRHLFYDTRLSRDGTFSCATCHQQARAFADDKARGVGVTGAVHPRGPMSLANVAYSSVLTWANPTVRRLEAQALVPMFGTDPIEMGLAGLESAALERLRVEPRYRQLFPSAFPDARDPFSFGNVTMALAAFERTLLSGRAPYDRYRTTMDAGAIPPAAHRGEDLFFSERLSCFRCHGGFNFSQAVESVAAPVLAIEFHNNGLYDVDGRGGYPPGNRGVFEVTREARDMGRFKPPTLRNIALTAPYMHDGSLPTLDAVVRHYERGGRASALRSPFVKGFTLSTEERADLIAFLESLTDPAFTTDPRLADPWRETAPAAGPSVAHQTAEPVQVPVPAPVPGIGPPRRLDFDAALRGVSLDPQTIDLSGGAPVPGRRPLDADALALVAAVLAQPALDRRSTGGIDARTVQEAFSLARSTAVDDLRILSAAYPTAADVIAGYALLGRSAFGAFVSASKDLGPRLKGDYSRAFALERFLGPAGDADGDGVSNADEHRATIARGRAAFVAAALDPVAKPD